MTETTLPPPTTAYERWIDQWDDAAWAALPEHRRRHLTRAGIERELYGEVVCEIAPALIELRQTWSMWQIAASLTPLDFTVNHDGPVGDRVAVARLLLFWVLAEYASQIPEAREVPELAAAMLCEHGTRDWAGSTYCGCDYVTDAIDTDGECDAQSLLPGYAWDEEARAWRARTNEVLHIRARMREAFAAAMARGYSGPELTLLLGRRAPTVREVDPVGADMLWQVGLEGDGDA